MTEEDALIASIRSNPFDDLRRLIYADWLDERNRFDEGEYLRLVEALVAMGTAINTNHPHVQRVLALVPSLSSEWRQAVCGRFDLWLDGYQAEMKISIIMLVRELTGYGLAAAKFFSESLPKAISGSVPIEEAVWLAARLASASTRYRIRPATEIPSLGLFRQDVTLRWCHWRDDWIESMQTIPLESRGGLTRLREILSGDPEFAHLASTVPQELAPGEELFSVTLIAGLLRGEAAERSQELGRRLLGGYWLVGPDTDPPFSGALSIGPPWL